MKMPSKFISFNRAQMADMRPVMSRRETTIPVTSVSSTA